MNRKVTYARLQTNAYVIGAGELGNVFPPQNKSLDNLTMTVGQGGLSMSFSYRGASKELLIPFANVVLMELAPEEKAIPSLKVAK